MIYGIGRESGVVGNCVVKIRGIEWKFFRDNLMFDIVFRIIFVEIRVEGLEVYFLEMDKLGDN